MSSVKREHIRKIVDVKVDGLNSINTYTIKAMYNQIDDDGFAETKFETISRFKLTWNEIQEMGGTAGVNRLIAQKYNVEKW